MIRKIPFNPVTALAAWEFPSEDGVFFLLFMRNGTPVKPIAYYDEAGTTFPFVGDYWTHEFERRFQPSSTTSGRKKVKTSVG